MTTAAPGPVPATLDAEGAGRRSRKDKARHYAIARGSAMASAAIVDVIARRKLGDATAGANARALYVRVVQMLGHVHVHGASCAG